MQSTRSFTTCAMEYGKFIICVSHTPHHILHIPNQYVLCMYSGHKVNNCCAQRNENVSKTIKIIAFHTTPYVYKYGKLINIRKSSIDFSATVGQSQHIFEHPSRIYVRGKCRICHFQYIQ